MTLPAAKLDEALRRADAMGRKDEEKKTIEWYVKRRDKKIGVVQAPADDIYEAMRIAKNKFGKDVLVSKS